MLCKESMVVAPVVIILYDRVFFFRSLRDAFAARWRLYGGLALTWIALLYMILPGPRANTVGFKKSASAWNYLLNQAVMITRYFRLAVWPHGLVVDYGPPVPLTLSGVLPQALFICSLLALTIAAFRWNPAAGFLGAWIFMTLAPTSSFVPINTEVGAERRMYLPLMAISALLTISAFHLFERRGSMRAAVAATAIVVVALGATTMARNRDYASELSMADSVLRHWPTDVAHGMRGSALARLHRDDEAIQELRLAARTDPRSRYNLGVQLFNARRLDEAIQQLERFAGENPMLDLVPSSRCIIGDAFMIQRKWKPAINQYRVALSMIPNDAETKRKLVVALNHEGIALAGEGKFDEAVAVFRQAVPWDPDNGGTHHNLAAALLDQHDAAAAEVEARKAIAINPADAGSYDLLGRTLAIQGRYDESIVQLQEALKLAPSDPEIQEDLRRVLAVRPGAMRN
jgi:tetratricopeptide (TPR) repeat protein